MKEDVAEFVSTSSSCACACTGASRARSASTPRPRRGDRADNRHRPAVTCLNPGLHLATLNADGKLQVEMTVKPGRGFSAAERNKEEGSRWA